MIRNAIILFYLVTALYFYNGASWNQNARLDTIYSFVEPGEFQYSFKIDKFLPDPVQNINTGDWAQYHGHYYSNKAPGTALIGIPFYFVIYHLESFFNFNFQSWKIELLNAYLINAFISIIPLCFGLYFFAGFLERLGCQERHANLIVLSLAFGTYLLPYSTQIWGHTTSAAFVMIALGQYHNSNKKGDLLFSFFLGLAGLCDYLAVVVLLPLLAIRFFNKASWQFMLLGLFPIFFIHCVYSYLCFEAPFDLVSKHMNQKFVDADKTFGVFGSLESEALMQLTFGGKRGIFQQMPVLMLCFYGVIRWTFRSWRDPWLLISLVSIIGMLLINSSFNGWHGGASIGARYQILALPFYFLILKEVDLSRVIKPVFYLLTLVSSINMLLISFVGIFCPDLDRNPLYGFAYNLFYKAVIGSIDGVQANRIWGYLTPFPVPVRLQSLDPEFSNFSKYTAMNFGELVGLPEGLSWIPLIVIFLLGFIYFLNLEDRRARKARSG